MIRWIMIKSRPVTTVCCPIISSGLQIKLKSHLVSVAEACLLFSLLMGVMLWSITPQHLRAWTQILLYPQCWPFVLIFHAVCSDPITAYIYWSAQIPGRSQIIPLSPCFITSLWMQCWCALCFQDDSYEMLVGRRENQS